MFEEIKTTKWDNDPVNVYSGNADLVNAKKKLAAQVDNCFPCLFSQCLQEIKLFVKNKQELQNLVYANLVNAWKKSEH